MNKVSLDTIGIAAFAHDFGTLYGKRSAVAEVFSSSSITGRGGVLFILMLMLGSWFPALRKIRTERMKYLETMNETIKEIALKLLRESREEEDGKASNTSIMGALRMCEYNPWCVLDAHLNAVRAEHAAAQKSVTEEEIIAQVISGRLQDLKSLSFLRWFYLSWPVSRLLPVSIAKAWLAVNMF